MKCAYCETDNPPGTKSCANCGFILREVDPSALEPREQPSRYSRRPAEEPPTYVRPSRARGYAKKPLIMAVIGVVVAVVFVANFALGLAYKSDPSMNALLYYSYSAPSATPDGSVHVFGDVDNLGLDDVDVLLRIVVTDIYSNSERFDVKLGRMPASSSIDVSEDFAWSHPCSSISELTVQYDILTRNPGLF